jgi:adenosylcobinamide-GDP ribazoletransferase
MRGALQFLTVLPVRAPGIAPGREAAWFPLVGAMLGLAAAAIWQVPLFGPLLALILLAVVTGGLHEDALADVCDALRAHRTRERMLAILDDSRIGAHGALALVFSVLLRWQALVHLQGDAWLRLPAVCGISRASMALLAGVSRPAGDGLGAAFVKAVPKGAPWLVGVQVIALSALAAWPGAWLAAAILVAGNAIAILALRWWFHARLGGVTGDCLGFACQLSETLSLVVLACV